MEVITLIRNVTDTGWNYSISNEKDQEYGGQYVRLEDVGDHIIEAMCFMANELLDDGIGEPEHWKGPTIEAYNQFLESIKDKE